MINNIIYISVDLNNLTNVKIGFTNESLLDKINALKKENPSIILCYAVYIDGEEEYYKLVDNILSEFLFNKEEGLFTIELEKVILLLQIMGLVPIFIESECEEENSDNQINPKMIFSVIRIPINSELEFLYNRNIKCKVISEYQIEYKDTIYDLRQLSAELLNINILGNMIGTRYWLYKGKPLIEIWLELYGN